MKTKLLALLLLAPPVMADFEVHEWGTFTTLSGQHGMPLNWYLPESDISALPPFIQRGLINSYAAKIGHMASVRMETPVIYFYPDEQMQVKVGAKFNNGVVTERYPFSESLFPKNDITEWIGELYPPDHAESLAMIPAVSADERGAHYAAARAVPDAWIFRKQYESTNPETKEPVIHNQADKFIFYRGAGNTGSPLMVNEVGNNTVNFSNRSPHDYEHGILLEVQNDEARWMVIPSISAHTELKNSELVSIQLSKPWKSIDVVENELVEWFHDHLTSEGLTLDEAKAMVATWHGTWFREPGMRAFSILPQPLIDEVLPLTIEPKPDKLVRVFVARHELLTTQKTERFAKVLVDDSIPDDKARNAINSLELGRFTRAAVQEAVQHTSRTMHQRHHVLSNPPATSMR